MKIFWKGTLNLEKDNNEPFLYSAYHNHREVSNALMKALIIKNGLLSTTYFLFFCYQVTSVRRLPRSRFAASPEPTKMRSVSQDAKIVQRVTTVITPLNLWYYTKTPTAQQVCRKCIRYMYQVSFRFSSHILI